MFIIALIIFIAVSALAILFFSLHLDLYFLRFKIDRHPVLRALVDDVIAQICREENLKTFYKTYEQLNEGVENENDKALGHYIYTLDEAYQKKVDDALEFIEGLELQYKRSYKDVCILVGAKTTLNKEDFVLPRILMCTDKLLEFGANSYYSTYFHELGHHFMIKETHDRHTEDDANRRARALVLERLPFFFQLFPYFTFEYRIDDVPELKFWMKVKACWGYLKYYLKNRNTIVRKK